jgi:alkylhydroperoxidase family enzyme
MAYIKTVEPAAATGRLREEYDAALARAGRVWNIVRLMSPNPDVLAASMRLYVTVLHAPSPLSRRRREMLAVVTSAANGCRY